MDADRDANTATLAGGVAELRLDSELIISRPPEGQPVTLRHPCLA